MKKYTSVDQYIAESPFSEELGILRDILLETTLKETLKWSIPTYTFKGKNIVSMGAFKSYFGLWFFQGALLSDPKGKLVNAQDGKTKALRQWRIASINDIEPTLIKEYVNEAIENQEKGLEIKPERKPLIVPKELTEALVANELLDTFETLGLTRQREYADYISEAKRPETKQRRIEKILPMIKSLRSLNDKYR